MTIANSRVICGVDHIIDSHYEGRMIPWPKGVFPAPIYVAALMAIQTGSVWGWQMKQAPLMTYWASQVDTNNPLPEYPRPQMLRSNWLSLNGLWQFQPGLTNSDPVPTNQTLSAQILVPYPMESALSGVMQYYAWSWYRRTFTVPANWAGQRIILHLEAVDWQTTLYVNGHNVGVHKGGYDPFSYDITADLVSGTNELILQVYSPEDNGGQPRGKQTLSPGGIMYTSSSGIWQPVWLEPVDASGITALHLVPDVDGSQLRLTVDCYASSGVTVGATVSSNGTAINTMTGSPQAELDIAVPNPNLWSPTNPFLYTLQVWTVHSGATNDNVSSYFGMRKISVQTVNGVPQIYLNNQPCYAMGPLDQGFWPDGIYTAPTDAALEYDLQLEKALGFNAVRKHIKVERQRWYYWADHLGLIVWQDMPSCNSYTGNANPPAVDHVDFIAELSAMVTNHWNSPALIMWDLFNEGQGQAGSGNGVGQTNTAYLVNLVKALDPSRLVNQASGGSYFGVGDVLDSHNYPDPGDPFSSTQAPVDGEFGGIAWHLTGHLWNPAQAGTSYLLASSLDQFASLYDGYINEAINFKSPTNGGLNASIYTQITDVENECNGLMSYDRFVKPNIDRISSSNLKAITGQLSITPVVPTSQVVPQTWKYTTNTPAGNWYSTNFNDSAWSTGLAGFGTPDPNVTPNTPWTTLGYIYLRRTFNPGSLTAQQLNNLGFTVYHDEDVDIFINGVFAASAPGYTTSYVSLPMTAEARAAIIPNGTNLLAVSCYQTTGGQFIDVGLSEQDLVANTNGIPETAPAILLPPSSQTVFVGGSTSFSAQAVGGNLGYQWYFGPTPIPGATSYSLTLSNVLATQAGNYSLVVSNAVGSATNAVTLTVASQGPQVLTLLHRYSFVSNASDSVGGAAWNGTIVPPNGGSPASINKGLSLPGGGGPGYSGYVSLPAGILTNTLSLTVECWATQNSQNGWAEIWSFNNGTGQYISFIPRPDNNNGNMSLAIKNGSEYDAFSNIQFPNGQEQYIAATFNAGTLTGNLYQNGSFIASVTVPDSTYIPGNYGAGAAGTTNNVLGQDPYPDPQFQGTLYELRIWNGLVSPLYLAVSAAAGPQVVATNLTPVSVTVAVTNSSMPSGSIQQASVTATFSMATNIPVTAFATNWVSSNPSVLAVNSNGEITAVNAGSANISATLNGVTGTSPAITVPPSGPLITQQPEAAETLLVGTTLTASVGNLGALPMVYRWYFNSGTNPLSVSAYPTLTLTNLQAAQAGRYSCLISNQYGTALSSNLLLTVVAPNKYQQSVLSLNPLGYWPLAETNGTTAYDLVNGYNGTYIGGCSLAQAGPPGSIFGSPSRSVLFNGSSGYVDIPEGPFNITGPITTVVWVELVSAPAFAGLFGHGDPSWRMTINTSGQPGANNGTSQPDATAPAGILDGIWHMLAYTYTGIPAPYNGQFYVDGSLLAAHDVVTAPAGDGLDVWLGGSPDYGTSRLLNARIAHAAIFPQALTAAQIQDLYTGVYAAPVYVQVTRLGSSIVLTWPAGTLLQAPAVSGPWTTNSTAVSPYTAPTSAQAQFFKVLVNP